MFLQVMLVCTGMELNGIKIFNGTVEEIKHVANDVIGDDHYLVSVGYWSINPPKPALGEFNNNTKKWKGYQFQIAGDASFCMDRRQWIFYCSW